MSIRDAFRVAIEALIANRMRTMLTMLGMVIGVGAVIALMAVGQGSQQKVTESISGLGSNLLFIRPGSQSAGGIRFGPGTAQTLSVEDADAIYEGVSGVENSVPQMDTGAQIIAAGHNSFARISGVTAEYAEIIKVPMSNGAFFTVNDVESATRVAVLGANVAKTMFPDGIDPVGQDMRINIGRSAYVNVQIVGVVQPMGGTVQSSNDEQVFLPITTVQHQIAASRGPQNVSQIGLITVKVATSDQIEAARQAITELLLQRHKVVDADFSVQSQSDIESAATQTSRAMTVLLGAIAGISLVVGGIGIMNIMLVSVTERTREIGIRKAVGASPEDILLQFLTEAMVVTVLGGLIGIAAGLGAGLAMDGRDIAGLGEDIRTSISWPSVAVAFGVSCFIGLLFGIYPAQRAANLKPIEALRYE